MEPNYLVKLSAQECLTALDVEQSRIQTYFIDATIQSQKKYRTPTEALQRQSQVTEWIWPWIHYLLAFTQEQKVSWNQGEA